MRVLVFCRVGCLIALANVAQAQTIDQATKACEGHNHAQAIAGCTQLLADPGISAAKRVEAYVNRGKTYYYEDDIVHALADLNEAIRLDPNNADAYSYRGITFSNRAEGGDKADYARAIADFTEEIRIRPDEGGGYGGRGNVYIHLGDADRAIAEYSAAIAHDPKYEAGWYNRGHTLFEKGDMVRAIPDLTAAIKLNPKNIFAIGFRAVALSRQGDVAAALRDADELLRFDPTWATIYWFRGDVFKELHRRDDAITEYHKALALKPEGFTKEGIDAGLKQLCAGQ
jgi:tetratricopeptide (TPR) repeat protein